ncbi:methionine ABC transporter ATP-binding protein [Paenibacillus beijingensis]|uniref:Methionine ABC transporter ATP-binding protein n=1 Tax=Paenibacillus beijingensis TaxID=1126833 RepID=A0A0D5NKJ5_9BACL|nr:methionine ABC transporter ATP-binding protein [Paenibacillus beijingensis]AJY75458.1 methionine ABC transporter ATP-binding protein [Paenibacillus beijingensis]
MIELRNISKYYGSGQHAVQAIRNISLQVGQGEIFGVIGHSGAGKSTLLRCVNLLERPTSGSVHVGETELTALTERQLQKQRRKIGIIFQHFNLLSTATVRDNIAFPLKLDKQSKAEIRWRVEELLQLVGLQEHGDKYPAQLSGGQKQRVGIARALANNPDVLLCDEATSALDPQTTQSILSLLQDINEELGITILLITHEMNVIRSICDRVAVMEGGEIVEEGSVLDVFLTPKHAVTQRFVSENADKIDFGAFKRRAGGQLFRIHYSGDETYEPILFETLKASGVSCAILHGTVSRIKHTPYGQLVVELKGEPSEIDRVVAAMNRDGLHAEVIS